MNENSKDMLKKVKELANRWERMKKTIRMKNKRKKSPHPKMK